MSYQEIHEEIRRRQESEQSAHTPLPWVLSEKHIAIRGSTPQGYYDPDKTVATTSPKNDDETRRADAEFIVRACNAHDDLLAACEAVLANLSGIALDDDDPLHALKAQLKAAITKAKGEQ